jgi:hypothetical protein
LTPNFIDVAFSNLQFSVTGQQSSFSTFIGSLAQIASGGGWTTTLTLTSSDASTQQVIVYFFDDNGNPLPLPLTFPQGSADAVTTSTFTGNLVPGAELIIQTTGSVTQATHVGYALLSSTGNVGAFATFTSQVGSILQQAVVPLESRNPTGFILPFDNTNDYVTGVALTNLGLDGVPFIIRDDTGAILLNSTIALPGRGHTSFAVPTNYPVTFGRRGTIEFQANANLSVLGLLFNPSGAFSTIPVIAK